MAQRTGQNLSRPVIGVTGNDKSFSPSWICIRLGVFFAGGQAIRISISHSVDRDRLQGLIVSGGDDIHPALYNREPIPKARYDQARDELEKEYIEYAFEKGIALLGICRGYQLINVICGGDLFSDISHMRRITANRNTILPKNRVSLDPDSKLAALFASQTFKINSLHHQAVDKSGQNLRAVAHDEDQIIQAIEPLDRRPVLGVQWHPEYMLYIPLQRKLFQWIVQACRSGTQSG